MSKVKILLVGPFPPPITGVSLANKVIYDYLPEKFSDIHIDKIDFSLNNFGDKSIGRFSFSKSVVSLFKYRFFYKILHTDIVYLTPGQTFWGIVKVYPFIVAAKLLGKEVVIHIHGDHVWREYRRLKGWKRRLFGSFFSFADKGIVLSERLRRNLRPFMDDRFIFEVPNFVEDYLFEIDLDSKLRVLNAGELRILFLSNLLKEKGILELMEALIFLKEKGLKFKAKIAGALTEEVYPRFVNLLKKMERDAEYLGVVKGRSKKEVLEWANIFVLPTYYSMEGQPISLLEAYATANVVLTTNHAGIPDIFKEGLNGFYVRKRDSRSIADKIAYLGSHIENMRKIMKINYSIAKRNYTLDKFLENVNRILRVHTHELSRTIKI